jgi:Raf kinase inhibitor-like YbhB/YbcL family protein
MDHRILRLDDRFHALSGATLGPLAIRLQLRARECVMPLTLTSTAFTNEAAIPDRHAKERANISPALAWSGVPKDTVSLALIMDDPDAPSGLFTHWIVYRIDPRTTELAENQPAFGELSNGARQGVNGFGETGYGGPQPPSGTHRYIFHLYALDTDTDIPAGLSRQEIDGVIEGHVIEEATLMGRYQSRGGTRAAG